MSYQSEIVNKKYVPNIVVRFKNLYWAIRSPDSGLTVDHPGLLDQVTINPTKVDPATVNSTINSYSFKLIDKNLVVTALFNGVTSFFQNEKVEIWVGRSFVNMPFSDYLKLPDTYVASVSRDNLTYNFRSTEIKNRVDRPAFNERNKLEVNIVPATTIIDALTPFTADTPNSGIIKINDEFISYASLDRTNNRFASCIRGEKNSIPAEHKAGDDIFFVNDVTGNPVDILLRLLISKGGGGTYDTLTDGAAIDEALVNVASFEAIRDEFFLGQSYNLSLYGIESILNYIEEEILFPNELRLISDNTSKLALTVLNRRIFDDAYPTIDNTSIKDQPDYSVEDSDIINSVSIEYDFSEGTQTYRKVLNLTDADSIAAFGKRETKIIKSKGIKEVLGGAVIAQNIAERFLSRFSFPKPEISFTAHMDKSLVNLGEKAQLVSTQLPNDQGNLDFDETLEVIERGINWKTGDVKFKLAFTSFSGLRECFLAPSDLMLSFPTPSSATVGAGRGALYKVGWKMRVYAENLRDYVSNDVLTITQIVGDVLTFDVPITTGVSNANLLKEDGFALLKEDGDNIALSVLFNNQARIMFADYDQVSESQRRYCFISDDGNNFVYDNKKSYQITL